MAGQISIICALVAGGNATVGDACCGDAVPCSDAIARRGDGEACLDAWADKWLTGSPPGS